jgi:hypothetical protein
MRYRFADGESLAVETGEAFHLRAGHLAEVLEESELIEFTAAVGYRRKQARTTGLPVVPGTREQPGGKG